MTIKRLWSGNYVATIPAMSATGSSVQVTAYGSTSDTCKVVSWGAAPGGGTDIRVACFGASGQPVDTYFTILYSNTQSTC
jgi:hypothetical protein